MSDNKNESCRDIFGDDSSGIEPEQDSVMSDEELAKYLAELTPDDSDFTNTDTQASLLESVQGDETHLCQRAAQPGAGRVRRCTAVGADTRAAGSGCGG